MATLITATKAEAAKQLCKLFFGFYPIINYYDTYVEISFTNDQQVIIRKWIEKQIGNVESMKGDFRVKVLPVLLPLLIKKGFPLFSGLLATGFFFGKRNKK